MIRKEHIRLWILRILLAGIVFSLGFIAWKQLETYKEPIKITGGSLHEGVVGTPRFVNPVLAQSSVDHDLTRLLFTPLLIMNPKGIEYKGLEGIDISEDKKVYTLFLKRGQKFHDGRTITSQDLAFTIAMIQDPLMKSPLANSWQGVEVEIIDNYTLTLTLSRPFNDFLYNLELGVLPKHIWENINPQEFIFSKYNIEPIGSGPYKVKMISYNQNNIPTKYTLRRAKQSSEKTYLDTLTISFFDNEENLMRALTKGSIEASYGLGVDRLALLPKTVAIYSEKLPRVFGIFLNQEKQNIFSSQKVREALNTAIDREVIINEVLAGYGYPIDSPYHEHTVLIETDQETAKRLLTEEGWVIGNEGILEKTINGQKTAFRFEIAIPNTEEIRAIAELIQGQLGQLGIDVIIRAYDQGNLNQNIIRTREYESLLFGYEVDRPSDLYAFWHSSQISDPGLNISLLKNTRVDVLLERFRNEGLEDISELTGLINDAIPALFLYAPAYVYVLPEKLRGVELTIQSSEDRFNAINDWYLRTRNVWPMFIDSNE